MKSISIILRSGGNIIIRYIDTLSYRFRQNLNLFRQNLKLFRQNLKLFLRIWNFPQNVKLFRHNIAYKNNPNRLDFLHEKIIRKNSYEKHFWKENFLFVMQTSAITKYSLRDVYQEFIENFIKLFSIGRTGSINASWSILTKISDWIETDNVKLIIAQYSGLDLNGVIFTKACKGDIGTTNENKRSLWQIYSICFVAYIHLCRYLKKPVDERYTLFRQADYDESKIDLVDEW